MWKNRRSGFNSAVFLLSLETVQAALWSLLPQRSRQWWDVTVPGLHLNSQLWQGGRVSFSGDGEGRGPHPLVWFYFYIFWRLPSPVTFFVPGTKVPQLPNFGFWVLSTSFWQTFVQNWALSKYSKAMSAFLPPQQNSWLVLWCQVGHFSGPVSRRHSSPSGGKIECTTIAELGLFPFNKKNHTSNQDIRE